MPASDYSESLTDTRSAFANDSIGNQWVRLFPRKVFRPVKSAGSTERDDSYLNCDDDK